MQLRTDTIGQVNNPAEEDIKRAISYPDNIIHKNDIVKLQINEDYYICFWIGTEKEGHKLFIKFGEKQLECNKTFTSNAAVEIMIKYLHRDMSWFKNYTWNQPISEIFLENLQILMKSE
ncbi:MAG: hypothetical protein PHH77_10840 [Victivallaceae bacterium]|nr:hypothetical protein [Victivallaceae bacterium]